MRVVELALEHEEALADFLADFDRAGETNIPAFFADPTWTHAEIVEHLARRRRGEGLPAGWVPGTTFFLIDEGRILGVANLRHRLTERLRQFGGHVGYSVRPSARRRGHATRLLDGIKEVAREMGMRRLLVTCDADNLASARVIEKCGGRFEGETIVEEAAPATRRYWIDLR
jgi:predicted acetyltransferase